MSFKETVRLAKELEVSETTIKPILYRVFDQRHITYDSKVVTRSRDQVMGHMIEGRNIGLVTVRKIPPNANPNYFMVSKELIINGTIRSDNQSIDYLFPLYLYPDVSKQETLGMEEPSTAPGGRRPNLSEKFIEDFQTRLSMLFVPDGKGDLKKSFGPEDAFDYMYAVFHCPTYRSRYAEFLKTDFPRLPLTSNKKLFRKLCVLGDELKKFHLMETTGKKLP